VLCIPVNSDCNCFGAFFLPQPLAAQQLPKPQIKQTDDGWKDLTKDVSRSENFERIIEARRRDDKERGASESGKAAYLPRPFISPRHTTFDDVIGEERVNSHFGVDIRAVWSCTESSVLIPGCWG